MKLSKKKRGNAVIDTILVLIVIFIFSVISITGYNFFTDLNNDIQADTSLDNSTKAHSDNLHNQYPSVFDGLFLIVLILFWALVLVASYMIDSRPIFFVFTVILLAAVFVVGAQFTNFYDDWTSDAEISSAAAEFPITNFVMSHLLMFSIAIGFSVVIVMFAKTRVG